MKKKNKVAVRPLDVREAAAELGVSVKTVRRMIKAGKIRAVDIGAGSVPRWRIMPGQLKKFSGDKR